MMVSPKDDCHCGKLKDRRAVQCRPCKDAEPTEKLCRGCHETFQIEEYNLRPNGRGGFKRRSRCKRCESAAAVQDRLVHPERVAAAKKAYNESHPEAVRRWANHRSWRKMGLDPRAIEALLKVYTTCEVCGDARRIVPDHDHNRIAYLRGFLCEPCNRGLGQFKDSPERLRAAADYLERTPDELGWCG